MTTKPHSNDEVIEEFRAMRPVICSVSAVSDDACDWLRNILAQKDVAVADARREGFIKGQKVGQVALLSHMVMEFDLPFERTPPDQTANPTN